MDRISSILFMWGSKVLKSLRFFLVWAYISLGWKIIKSLFLWGSHPLGWISEVLLDVKNILAGNKTFWKKKKSSWGQYLQNPYYSSDRNGIRTHNHLVCKWTLNHLQTKWLWVQIPLLSLKLQISRLFRTKSSLTFRQLLECGFTLKCVRDMIITYSL